VLFPLEIFFSDCSVFLSPPPAFCVFFLLLCGSRFPLVRSRDDALQDRIDSDCGRFRSTFPSVITRIRSSSLSPIPREHFHLVPPSLRLRLLLSTTANLCQFSPTPGKKPSTMVVFFLIRKLLPFPTARCALFLVIPYMVTPPIHSAISRALSFT